MIIGNARQLIFNLGRALALPLTIPSMFASLKIRLQGSALKGWERPKQARVGI